jgi:zinc transporter ZupT
MNRQFITWLVLVAIGITFIVQSTAINAKEIISRIGMSIIAGSFVYLAGINFLPEKGKKRLLFYVYFVLGVAIALGVGVGIGMILR